MASETRSAVLSAMLFVTLLVAIGFGFSKIASGRIEVSKKTGSLRDITVENEREINRLKMTLAETAGNFRNQSRITDSTPLEQVRNAKAATARSNAELANRSELIREETEQLKSEFLAYAEAYREQVWKGAVGKKITSLILKNGRHFERVIITRVTPEGLLITHAHGAARIAKEDLSLAYRERFQWSREDVPGFDWDRIGRTE